MKRMNKLLACVLALILALSTLSVVFAAEAETELKAEKSGENVVVTLVSNSELVLGGVSGTLNYDKDAFELTGVASEKLDCDSNLETGAFAAEDAEVNVAAGDVLVTFTLAKKDAFEKNKEYTFSVVFDEFYDNELEDLEAEAPSATYVEKLYTVTFDSDGGSAVEAQEVDEGETATKPADPTKDGYTFKGWQLDGEDFDFGTAITGDITLKAVWEKNEEPKPDDSPATGDRQLVLWGSLLAVSAAGAVGLAVAAGRKKGKHEM